VRKALQPQYFKNIPTGCLLGACSGLQPVGFSPYSPFAFRSDEWNKHKLNTKVSEFAKNFFSAILWEGKLLQDFGSIATALKAGRPRMSAELRQGTLVTP
jgi:hypothetical protein